MTSARTFTDNALSVLSPLCASAYVGGAYNKDSVSSMNDLGWVVVHELGHSLYDLGDEYTSGGSDDSTANCDNSKSCSRWADLIGRPGMDAACTSNGCRGGDFYTSGSGVMKVFGSLHVPDNVLRYMCCTHYAFVGSPPEFCRKFEISPGYLLDYCRLDHLGFGVDTYPPSTTSSTRQQATGIQSPFARDGLDGVADHGATSKYKWAASPVFIYLDVPSDGGSSYESRVEPGLPGLYPGSQMVSRQLRDKSAAIKAYGGTALEVVLTFADGLKPAEEVMYVDATTAIDVPPLKEGQFEAQAVAGGKRIQGPVMLVLDSQGRSNGLDSVTAKLIK